MYRIQQELDYDRTIHCPLLFNIVLQAIVILQKQIKGRTIKNDTVFVYVNDIFDRSLAALKSLDEDGCKSMQVRTACKYEKDKNSISGEKKQMHSQQRYVLAVVVLKQSYLSTTINTDLVRMRT